MKLVINPLCASASSLPTPCVCLALKAIFGETAQFEIMHLSVPGALDDANLSLVLIDAECTGHLFELIATFRQVRPS